MRPRFEPRRLAGTVRSVVALGRESELSFLAGGIAFFSFFAVVPGILLVVAVGSVIGRDRLAAEALSLFESYLSEEGAAVVGATLSDTTGAVGASVIGVLGLFWSTLKMFRAVDVAFDRIYGHESAVALVRRLVNAATVVGAIAVGVPLLVLARRLVIRTWPQAAPIWIAVLIGGLTLLLAPLYYLMPPVEVSVRDIVPGTVTAVVGFVILRVAFAAYTGVAGQYLAYGFLGAVLLFLLWLYFGALVLLFGAVVNAAVTGGVRAD